MTTAFIIVGCIVVGSFVLAALAVCGMSGRHRETWQDDEQCEALAEWNTKHRKPSNTAVSASH